MKSLADIKNDFTKNREKLFADIDLQKESLKFSMQYSLLVEEYIQALVAKNKYNFALASAGSFSRRELSPYSDIDLMFISDSLDGNEADISRLITLLWDSGIEVSHTIRDFNDIQKFLETDLHSFTQFFETRFLSGSDKIYHQWNDILFELLNEEVQKRLLFEMFNDISDRYKKYGESPKVLEPNVKNSAGGLRDFQAIEWMFIIKNKVLLNKQKESTQAEIFISLLKKLKYTTRNECKRLIDSYKVILEVRNLLHLFSEEKNDRFEFSSQQKISRLFYHQNDSLSQFMKDYFNATNVINRFSKSMIKRFSEEITNPLPDSLSIQLDEDFVMKGKTIYYTDLHPLSISDVLRAFYYRGLYNAYFDENFTSQIIELSSEVSENNTNVSSSSVFFREILKLQRNVGQTLIVMNELGTLGAFLPEFKDLFGFMQHGVYHFYTTDEHTLLTIQNVEKLEKNYSQLGKIYHNLKEKEILFLALLFHDIAKPINFTGHEIIGAEMASSIMQRLGYSEDEIEKVAFLVRNHLVMEQTAFRRNLNDPETLNNFTARFNTIHSLDLLYLVTYADLSAVNSAVWTSWKSDLLAELYRKAKAMLEEQITGEELLMSSTYIIPKEISKHSEMISEEHVQEHIDSINDIGYAIQFSEKDIANHVEEIQKGLSISVLFKELKDFTNVTVITKDIPSLLSKICGVLSINDANIHDAKIFTRKDKIVIDTFNVTDFRTHKRIETRRYEKIRNDLNASVTGMLQLNREFANMKSRFRRIENKLFKRSGKVKVVFENHEKYTIIDIFSPDRLGFLYQVTRKMNELGLNIFFAKISTRGDDIVDSFYVLNRRGKKISSNDQALVKAELTGAITHIL
jgi:[protein-PII] uridylyltransferase